MGIKIFWDNDEQTAFRYQFDEPWTWDEFFAAKDQAKVMMDAVPHKFGVIMDVTHILRLPPDSLAHARHALRSGHPRAFVVVLVVGHPVVRTVIGTLRDVAPLAPRAVDIVASLDEARARIQQRLVREASDSSGG